MPANKDNPRVKAFGLKEADVMIAKIVAVLGKARGLRKAIEKVEGQRIQIDGGKGAVDGLKVASKFLSKCQAAADE